MDLKKIPVRVIILIIIFLLRMIEFSLLDVLNQSQSYLVSKKTSTDNKPWCLLTRQEQKSRNFSLAWKNRTLDDYGPRYELTLHDIHKLTEIGGYGQLLGSVPGGVLAEYLGPQYLILYSLTGSATLNLVSAFTMSCFGLQMGLYMLMGLHMGILFSSIYCWIARWSPSTERGIFVATSAGYPISNCFGKIFSELLLPVTGWQGMCVIRSCVAYLFAIAIWFLGSNHPSCHKYISDKELYYIRSLQREKVTTTKSFPPFMKILLSKVFWTTNILNFGHMVTSVYYLTLMALYLKNIMGIDVFYVFMIQTGQVLGNALVIVGAGLTGDYLRIKNIRNDTEIIKVVTFFSHIIPGALLLCMGAVNCHVGIVTIIIMIVAFAAHGSSILSSFRTKIDIAPNYAGTICGLMHMPVVLIQIYLPRLLIQVTNNNPGIIGWSISFLFGGMVIISTGIVFMCFGDDKCQWWNLKSQDVYRRMNYRKRDSTVTTRRNNDTESQTEEQHTMQTSR